MIKSAILPLAAAAVLMLPASAFAESATATINAITAEGVGAAIGTAKITDSKDGAVFEVELKGLSGERGFHVHEKGDCGPGEKDGKKQAGLAAGPHFDPTKAGKHAGPHGEGHTGDLPKLTLKETGEKITVTAPRVKVSDIVGRALVVHEAGDNYADEPAPLGGGKSRVACGVIQASK